MTEITEGVEVTVKSCKEDKYIAVVQRDHEQQFEKHITRDTYVLLLNDSNNKKTRARVSVCENQAMCKTWCNSEEKDATDKKAKERKDNETRVDNQR